MECVNPIVSTWRINNSPAVNTAATISQGAAAGLRHVCTGFVAVLGNGAVAAAGTGTCNLRDGATGAGTLLWSMDFAIPAVAGSLQVISVSGLNIVGSTNTAMTLEFTAGGGANTSEKVNICGYDIV